LNNLKGPAKEIAPLIPTPPRTCKDPEVGEVDATDEVRNKSAAFKAEVVGTVKLLFIAIDIY
jgi:hypothetical protein